MNGLEIESVQDYGQTLPRYPRELSTEEIEALLPHRGDILFARRIRLLGPDQYLGYVRWDATSMGIPGHFPSLPIIPAVYLIEAAAQTAGAGMLASQLDAGMTAGDNIGVLAGVRRCAFIKPVLPGQQVVFDLTTQQGSGHFIFVKGTATVNNLRVATFDLIIAFAPRSQIFVIN